MKRLLGLAILILVTLAGCTQIAELANPIVGTWTATVLGVTTTEVFNADSSFTETVTVLGGVGVTKSGTWDSTDTTITRVMSDSTTDAHTYSFNSDKSKMTLLLNISGVSITLDRM
ncbi:MAG: hypothetical protein WCT14_01840 [Treponemataceae bacterium]